MSTFLQLVNRAKLELGVEGAPLVAVIAQVGMDAKLVSWVAEADYAIQAAHFDWDFLWSQFTYTTVASDSTILPPSDLGVWDIESVWLDYTTASAAKLVHVTYKEFLATIGSGVKTNAVPIAFTIQPDDKIKLDPPADKAYALTTDYWRAPSRLADLADTSPIPPQYERAIIARTKMYFAEEEEFPSLYSLAAQEFLVVMDLLESHQLPGLKRQGLTTAPALAVAAI